MSHFTVTLQYDRGQGEDLNLFRFFLPQKMIFQSAAYEMTLPQRNRVSDN